MQTFKQLILFALLSSYGLQVDAQSLSPQVIASGGNSLSGGGYTLDFTIGETIITTLSTGNSILTQGFHQPISTYCAVTLWLEGPFNGSSMSNNLQAGGLIPLAQPFNTAPWNYMGNENLNSVPTNATDWVLLELRTSAGGSNSGGVLVATRAALLYNNGNIYDINGNNYVTFNNIKTGNYYIAVKPRSNLAVMSANVVALPNQATPYNFSSSIAQAYGTTQMKLINGQACLLAGDFDHNGIINWADSNRLNSEMAAGSNNIYKASDANKDRNLNNLDFNLFAPNAQAIGTQAIRY